MARCKIIQDNSISTMSALAQQLNKLKQQNVASIAPGAPKATLLLDKTTARSTTLDTLFTMAVLGYTEIKRELFPNIRVLAEELLSQANKEINRNKMSKDENRLLSGKITRFLIGISGLMANRGCQAVLEYLLRNYQIHIFEGEQLAIIFLQYWQDPMYLKLISNIQLKSPSLQFLVPLQSPKASPVNFTYILKSVTHCRSLLSSLILFTRKYIKQQSSESEEYEIELVTKQTSYRDGKLDVQEYAIVKKDIRQFLLQVLCGLLERGIEGWDKDIEEFCIFVAKESDEEVYSMAMILSLSLLAKQKSPTSQWISRVLTHLLSKSLQLNLNTFNFILIIWQRWPTLITHQIIDGLLEKQYFILRMTEFGGLLYMPFYGIFDYLMIGAEQGEGEESETTGRIKNKGLLLQILRSICLKVKQEEFVRIHQSSYFNQIFTMFHQSAQRLESKAKIAISKFISDLLAYQYAIFVDEKKITSIAGILSKEQVNKNGSINWKNIKKAEAEKIVEEQRQPSPPIEEQSQQQQYKKVSEPHKSLLSLLSTQLGSPVQSLTLTPETHALALNLLSSYYSEPSPSLSPHNKNKLLEIPSLFTQFYNAQKFYYDLQRRDYHTAIRYLMGAADVAMCRKVLEAMAGDGDGEAVGDLLYRELCRQAGDRLGELAVSHYKAVINALGKLYHQYCKNTQPQLIKPLNQLMLRLSSTVLSRTGRQKGKFYSLMASHSHFLSTLTLSHTYSQSYALETYLKLLEIFGQENSYCFIIGVAQDLATKEKNRKLFGDFVDRVLMPSIKGEGDQGAFKGLLGLFNAIYRCLVFCSYMLQDAQKEEPENQEAQNNNEKQDDSVLNLQPGVAKKMITNFFGLQSSKSRRSIVRKILLFLSSLPKSKLSVLFQQTLSLIPRKKQLKLCATTTKMYRLLTHIEKNTMGPLRTVAGNVKGNLLRLFPIQLKIDVLGPLLPDEQSYGLIGADLEAHGGRFQSLGFFVDVLPDQLSDSWCKFAIECLKRSYIPSPQTITQILALYSPQSPLNANLIKFLCTLTQSAREQSLPLLPLIMPVIFQQTRQANSYTLAIFYTLIKNMGEFLHPYLSDMFGIGVEVEDQNFGAFADGVVGALTASGLVELVKLHAKTVRNFNNFSYFLNKVSQKVTFESIWKTSQNFFSRSLSTLLQSELPFEALHLQQSQIFITQALKMNQNQLRKVIIDYVRWAAERTSADDAAGLVFNARRNLLIVVMRGLTQRLGELFLHFYGYVFDDLVADLNSLKVLEQHKSIYSTEKTAKRDRQMSEYSLSCTAMYTRQILQTLQTLFVNDPKNQFVDSQKFDQLTPSLCQIFTLTGFSEHYSPLISRSLQPCLLALFTSTLDDYKLKTVNTEILRILRTKDTRILSSIYAFYEEVIGKIGYRFLLFSDEMVPLLIEASSGRNAGIRKLAQGIIYQLQNLSGRKIDRIGSNR